jgi:hypothetical protein
MRSFDDSQKTFLAWLRKLAYAKNAKEEPKASPSLNEEFGALKDNDNLVALEVESKAGEKRYYLIKLDGNTYKMHVATPDFKETDMAEWHEHFSVIFQKGDKSITVKNVEASKDAGSDDKSIGDIKIEGSTEEEILKKLDKIKGDISKDGGVVLLVGAIKGRKVNLVQKLLKMKVDVNAQTGGFLKTTPWKDRA